MAAYMKNYSYLWTISYDVIILICSSKCQGSKLSAFKFPILWGVGFETCEVFIRSRMISKLLLGLPSLRLSLLSSSSN